MKTPKLQLKELKNLWYKKLKDSGFEDIEQDSQFLKQNTGSTILDDIDDVGGRSFQNTAKAEYYRLVGHFLHEYPFQDDTDRIVWEFYSNGVSIRDTVAHFHKKRMEFSKDRVSKILTRLKKEMFNMYRGSNAQE